ncbi:hypothetical protein SD77_0120 [Bacillus badius]|uniref:Uncharacterized protein n=1 Tax=Bacillus badius TaxID=1455 RepID=A0ABR5AZT9_BACBA|nr:hypothetical protein SD78_3450 [Bacillus badius]KIL80272.1 hypothetical protein SD77_0120 [Bacillus badius]
MKAFYTTVKKYIKTALACTFLWFVMRTNIANILNIDYCKRKHF